MTLSQGPVQLTAYLPCSYFYDENKTLEDALVEAFEGVRQVQQGLRTLPEDRLHQPVALGRWSPGEYADHLARTNWLFARRLRSHLRGEPMEHVGFGAMFPDGRVVAHAGTVPLPGRTNEELTRDLHASHRAVVSVIEEYRAQGRLTEPCLPHQYFGVLNARETAQLAAAHYHRHMAQFRPESTDPV